jgi:hypothetical protein
MTNPNDPISPIVADERMSEYSDMPPTMMSVISCGITKREMFAAMAMQGYLSAIGQYGMVPEKDVADSAVRFADALIVALNKEEK